MRRIISRESTNYQTIEIVDDARYGRMLLLDGVPQTSSRYQAAIHEPAFLIPLWEHVGRRGNPTDAPNLLILGGGDLCGWKVLREQMVDANTTVVEIDLEVARLSAKFLHQDEALHERLIADGALVIQDAAEFLARTPPIYDVIYLDLTDLGTNADSVWLHLDLVKAALAPGGSIAFYAESPEPTSSHASDTVWLQIIESVREVFRSGYLYRCWTPPYQEMFIRGIASESELSWPVFAVPGTQWLTSPLLAAMRDYWPKPDLRAIGHSKWNW